jgi:hypothetical protein
MTTQSEEAFIKKVLSAIEETRSQLQEPLPKDALTKEGIQAMRDNAIIHNFAVTLTKKLSDKQEEVIE